MEFNDYLKETQQAQQDGACQLEMQVRCLGLMNALEKSILKERKELNTLIKNGK